MCYQIITDATADMDWALWDAAVIPMEVMVGRQLRRYGPEGDLSVENFYDALRRGERASTSQITIDTYNCVFEEYLRKGTDILYLSFSSGMSGTFQSACISAAELRMRYPKRKILCVDTRSASIKEGFLVYKAARRKAEGMGLEALADWAAGQIARVRCRFLVDDLNTLKRGGRISPATALMGTTLQIKPLLTINGNGRLELVGKIRGRRRAIDSLLDYYARNSGQEGPVLIGHGDCRPDADGLAQQVKARFPGARVLIAPVGPVIGAHTGPGMLSIAFWGAEQEPDGKWAHPWHADAIE